MMITEITEILAAPRETTDKRAEPDFFLEMPVPTSGEGIMITPGSHLQFEVRALKDRVALLEKLVLSVIKPE